MAMHARLSEDAARARPRVADLELPLSPHSRMAALPTLVGRSEQIQKLDLASIDRAQVGDMWKFVFDGLLQVENMTLDSGNPLQEELGDFLRCVRERAEPLVSGADGVAAVAAAEMVLAAIAKNRWE